MKYFIFGLLLSLITGTGTAYTYLCVINEYCPFGPREIIDANQLKPAYKNIFAIENNIDAAIPDTDDLVQFLKRHPKTILSIEALYNESEKVSNGFSNKGEERLDKIVKRLNQKGISKKQLKTSIVKKDDFNLKVPLQMDFIFSETYRELNNGEIKTAYRQLNKLETYISFEKNKTDVNVNSDASPVIEEINYYLNRNKDQQLKVTMPYQSSEIVEAAFKNMGEARSRHLLSALANQKILEENMTAGHFLAKDIFDENGYSKIGVVDLNLILPDKSSEAIIEAQKIERGLENVFAGKKDEDAAAGDEVKNEQLLALNEDQPEINFQYGSDRLFLTNDIDKYAKKLKQYLDEHPKKKIEIYGHTCDLGPEDKNEKLGFNRAGSVMLMLVDKNIDRNRIEIKTKGERAPAYSNRNSSGRKKNRRVEINIR